MGTRQVAWVESPLQLLGAAEFAAAQGRAVDVALRVGPQMAATAELLLQHRAYIGRCIPYLGIPWGLLGSARSWVVGDGFSGQFHAALATMGAREVTLLDDGLMTLHLARALTGARPFGRPDQATSGRRALLASLARDRMLALAARERLAFHSVFEDHEALRGLGAHGIATSAHDFSWLRSVGRPIELPGDTVLLGSAAVTDGRMGADEYLRCVREVAADRGQAIAYLPHRREPEAVVARVGEVRGITVVRTGIPIELALAGTRRPLDIITPPSTAAVTLRLVLAGTGSTIRTLSRRMRLSRPATR